MMQIVLLASAIVKEMLERLRMMQLRLGNDSSATQNRSFKEFWGGFAQLPARKFIVPDAGYVLDVLW